jgi:small subunit ribosomal protein S15
MAREERNAVIQQFKQSEYDTGSAEVQVALLTHDINELNVHCMSNPKDFSSKRGLLRMVCRRKRLLSYLKDTKISQYKNIIEKLGLRK